MQGEALCLLKIKITVDSLLSKYIYCNKPDLIEYQS